jgi:CrcB protein
MTVALFLAVAVAGALATLGRYAISLFVSSRSDESWLRRFPYAVFVVNAVGSFIAGLAAGFAASQLWSADARLIVVTGVAGGLTTFSTFSVETIELAVNRRFGLAVLSVSANLAVGLAFALGGYLLGAGA